MIIVGRDDRAIQAAQDLVDRFALRMPVDLELLTYALEIDVRLEDLDDVVSGLVVLDRRRPLIAVNRAHHPNRRRFTIAHEIGHFTLHRARTKFFLDASPVFFRCDDAPATDPIAEREANKFAAELLMPTDAIRQLIQAEPIDPFDETDIRRLADRLRVSPQALTIRLTELELIV